MVVYSMVILFFKMDYTNIFLEIYNRIYITRPNSYKMEMDIWDWNVKSLSDVDDSFYGPKLIKYAIRLSYCATFF